MTDSITTPHDSEQDPTFARLPEAGAPTTTPLRIEAPEGAQEFSIHWKDGAVLTYPHDIVRGYCPCAECQGHGGEKYRYRADENTDLRDVAQQGNYALRLTWGDGHASGIYTFRYLRYLGNLLEGLDADTLRVAHGIRRA